MYITFRNDNGEEEIPGPYELIEEDSRTDDTITFHCLGEDEGDFITTPYAVSFMTEFFYNETKDVI